MARDIKAYVEQLATSAKEASRPLGFADDESRQAAVRAMAQALRDRAVEILDANERDMVAACEAGTSEGLLDRLLLTPERIEGMAAGLEKLADLPDPVGRVLEHRTIDQGLDLKKVSVPLGLVAMVCTRRAPTSPPTPRASASAPVTPASCAAGRSPSTLAQPSHMRLLTLSRPQAFLGRR